MNKLLNNFRSSLPSRAEILPSENKEVINYKIDGVYYRAYYSPIIKEVLTTKLKNISMKQSNIPTFFH